MCERILVDAPRRNVNEQFLETVFYHVAPIHRRDERLVDQATYQDPKAAHISELLKIHLGSRNAVAKEMGISTTTLWRYMKKFGIQG